MVSKNNKTFVFQTSLASGELSPSIMGRIDREIYYNGARKLRNVRVTPLGGVLRREGTGLIEATQGNVKGRLVTFKFSATDVYLLAFTPGRMKVYKNGVLTANITASPLSDLTAGIIATMTYTQSLNTLLLFHPDLRTIQILRASDSSWTPSYRSFTDIPTYDFGVVVPTGTMTAAAVSGTAVTITASASVFAGSVGAGWALRGNGGYAYLVSITSATQAVFKIADPFDNTSAFSSWTLEEPVWSTTRGWPICGTFWNQRLWIGGSKSRPQTVWGSKIAGFFDFNFGTGQDAEAIESTLDDDEVNTIKNIFGSRTLQVFSESAEYFSPVQFDRTVTPKTFRLERGTRHGSNQAIPVSSDGATIFVENSGRVVREFLFLDVEQSYIADDISFLSEHLINNPKYIALQKSSESIAGEFTYFCNEDGTIAVLNRRRSQSFIAWTLFETDGEFEDVAVVGNVLYVIVKRIINGNTVRYIEQFTPNRYTDCGLVLSDSPAKVTWTGLTHLEAKEVSVRSGAGYALLRNTVTSGSITVEVAQTQIEVGLPFDVIVETVSPEKQGSGALSGERRRIVSANFFLKDSNGFDVYNQNNNRTQVTLTKFGDIILDEVPELFNGWYRVGIAGHSREPFIKVVQQNPVDLHILSIKMEVTI